MLPVPVTPRPRPAPSSQAMVAAKSIQLAHKWGIRDTATLANLIDCSTRSSQLNAVAIAAAKLLVALPAAACRKQRGRRTRLTACRGPVLKLAYALKALAAEDMSLALGTMRTVKKLTSKSFSGKITFGTGRFPSTG